MNHQDSPSFKCGDIVRHKFSKVEGEVEATSTGVDDIYRYHVRWFTDGNGGWYRPEVLELVK